MAKFPYQCLHVCGDILVAARGTSIHTFNTRDGSHISTWKHPSAAESKRSAASADADAAAAGAVKGEEEADIAAHTPQSAETPEPLPPSKRRKIEPSEGNEEEKEERAESQTPGPGLDGSANGEAALSKKAGKKQQRTAGPPPAEIPIVTLLEGTPDGRYVVALTGQDKTIWVLEHDGMGHLVQQSRRTMPKRPSSIAITPDGKTIISADKFGDVYSLPVVQGGPLLLPSSSSPSLATPSSLGSTAPATTSSVTTGASLVGRGTKQPPSSSAFTQASTLTVHTQRNLRALEDQRRNYERLQREKADKDKDGDSPGGGPGGGEPPFEHTLLLGHVSMLTAVALASSPSSPSPSSSSSKKNHHHPRQRTFILTADRDEHIRVSRAPPQAHVIEAFCLGAHAHFVSRLCVVPPPSLSSLSSSQPPSPSPPSQPPSRLISGGGDDALFAWDWRAGRLLSRAPLLPLVRDVVPEATKLAVSGIYATPTPTPTPFTTTTAAAASGSGSGGGKGYLVLVTCECVPALFTFLLPETPISTSTSTSTPAADANANTNALVHLHTTRLPGNPLDLGILPPPSPDNNPSSTSDAAPLRLVVAVDPAAREETSLLLLTSTPSSEGGIAAGWEMSKSAFTGATPAEDGKAGEDALSRDEVEKLLYTIENLRKADMDDAGAPEGEP